MDSDFQRPQLKTLSKRLQEPRRFLQVLAGPRQVGKTTLARQAMKLFHGPSHYASADEPTLKSPDWLDQQWEIGRKLLDRPPRKALLVLDEIQKITGWSDRVKKLWDEDTSQKRPLKVMILGSAPLLVQQGLTESLAGRFEILPISHWSFSEMKDAFGFNLSEYLFFGAYPGAAPLIQEEERWSRYILDSLVETSLSRDILLLTRVDKPALLRHLFHLGCDYSGQILSYQKMLGQLQDAGNTTTLAHYLELLSGAGMLKGLTKFSGTKVRQRGSSPKFQVFNTALLSAAQELHFEQAQKDRSFWGRLVESAIGAHLLNDSMGTKNEIYYWREGIFEVDFIIKKGKSLAAIEVKSGRKKETLPGMQEFSKKFNPKKKILVGEGGFSIEEFLTTPASYWLE